MNENKRNGKGEKQRENVKQTKNMNEKKIIDEACERFDNVFLFNSKLELSEENVVKINIDTAEEKIGSLLSNNTAILFKASRSV